MELELAPRLYHTARIYTRDDGRGGGPALAQQQLDLWHLAQVMPVGHIAQPGRYEDHPPGSNRRQLDRRPGLNTLLRDIGETDIVLCWTLPLAAGNPTAIVEFLRLILYTGAGVIAAREFGEDEPLRLEGGTLRGWIAAMDYALTTR